MYSQCLREGLFPDMWKLQKLVLIPKAGKPSEEASSYRPICLIDALGKVFERLICTRLEEAISSGGGLSPHQYGFRKCFSTTDTIRKVADIASKAKEGTRWKGSKQYCLIATLDVKNAFNTADWRSILDAPHAFGVPEYLRVIVSNYFCDREPRYFTSEGPASYSISAGVPQGSVLGRCITESCV